jgi:hypothetical protein
MTLWSLALRVAMLEGTIIATTSASCVDFSKNAKASLLLGPKGGLVMM